MALRLSATLITAVVFGLVAVFITVQSSPANASAPASANNQSEAPGNDYRAASNAQILFFDCTIPRVGSAQCGRQFSVRPNEGVSIYLRNSGGKKVDFSLYTTGGTFKVKRRLAPNTDSGVIWRNTSRSTVRMKFLAASPAVVRVQATGYYRIK